MAAMGMFACTDCKKSIALAMLVLLVLLLMPYVSQAAEEYWLSEIANKMLSLQVKGWGNFQPYWGQLQAARVALRKGDDAAAHTAMNRFMNMLENRENGIAAPIADWLFQYCDRVMPVKFRDPSRSS